MPDRALSLSIPLSDVLVCRPQPQKKKQNDKCMHACFTCQSGRRVADCRPSVPAPSVRKCKKTCFCFQGKIAESTAAQTSIAGDHAIIDLLNPVFVNFGKGKTKSFKTSADASKLY